MTLPLRYSLLLLVCYAGILAAQTPEKRVALVIGNSKYVNAPLGNPANDAVDMAQALRRAGFSVTEKYDQNTVELNNAVTEFTRQFTNNNTVALFYFAGHGIQDRGENYLVPIDADNLVDDEITYRCVPLERITSKMKDANNYLNIVILDACRSYPVRTKGRTLPEGLARFEDDVAESLVAYATGAGRIALDQSGRRNGLFTEKLLQHLLTPGLEIRELFFEVGREVKAQSGNKQIPSLVNNLTRKFYFVPAVPANTAEPAPVNTDPASVPTKKEEPEEPSEWSNWFGVSYSRFGAKDGPSYSSLAYNAYGAYYALIKEIGGYLSLGGYAGNFDVGNNTGLSVPTAFLGAIGPGVRFLNTDSGIKGYVFAGLMFFNVKKDEEIFGHVVDDRFGYQFLLATRIKNAGFKIGYTAGFENTKGVTVGGHYCF